MGTKDGSVNLKLVSIIQIYHRFRDNLTVIFLQHPLTEQNILLRVWSQDGSGGEVTRTGAGLMQEGVRGRLPGKFSSDLVFLEVER